MVIKRGRFIIDIYKATIHIVICKDAESLTVEGNKILKKFKEDIVEGLCLGLCIAPDKKPNTYYLLLASDSLDINTITHETDHLRNYIIDFCSLTENTDSKEASANLNGFINEKVFGFLKKHKFEIKY